MIRLIVALAAALAGLALLAGCATEGVVDESLDLRAGDCFEDPGYGEFETVDHVSCSAPGAVRVTERFTMPGAPGADWPGADAIENAAIARCPLESTSWFGPTKESRDGADDRVVLCLVD